ncbi:methyltransferase [Roseicella sp. DB1501]|uniref:methyltransferase n=1 Tax=Roseicella sp. DB1501 TaxID=2730925 RepID=UPI001490A274|nr:methyltransferase [Roseicella sp. DB1501]NOG71926.1 methyltransferase domain-containing protein [Roseicella sp. DB1501]
MAARVIAPSMLPGALDRLRDLREGLVANPRFRRWAARFPLTRPVARRRTRALFDLCAGFVYSQVLLACVRLRLCELLRAEGPMDAAALAPRLGLGEAAAQRLLGAAASLGLVARRRGGRFALGSLGAALIDNAGLVAMVEHHAALYADLSDPVALLRGERHGATDLARLWPYAGRERPDALDAEAVAAYSTLMAASQAMIAEEVLDVAPLRAHRCLLDLGGGEGVFLAAAAARAPHLRLLLFDLPAVAARARARFARAGLEGRASAIGGDFLRDPLPGGADLISLVRVLHDHDDAAALAILRAVRRALPPGGRLLLAEPMAGTPEAEPAGEAYFGFYLLAMGQGRPRRPEEIDGLLRAAGFAPPRLLHTGTPLLVRVMLARLAT